MNIDPEILEDFINSDELFSNKSKNQTSNSNANIHHKDIVKLNAEHFRNQTFLNATTKKVIYMGRPMSIIRSPSKYQRVRYENECRKTVRYISVPENQNFTIKIPDLRDLLVCTESLWMRITRTTIRREKDRLIFYHPYPIWIRNRTAQIHNGSIYIQITPSDRESGFIEMNALTLIRLKQEDLLKIRTLGVYSSYQLDFSDFHLIESKKAKHIRDDYQLQQSVLNFQLVRVDKDNVAYPTDCFCQTEPLCELEDDCQLQQSVLDVPFVRDDQNNIPYLTDSFCQTEPLHELDVTAQMEASQSQKEPSDLQKWLNQLEVEGSDGNCPYHFLSYLL